MSGGPRGELAEPALLGLDIWEACPGLSHSLVTSWLCFLGKVLTFSEP